MRPTLRLKSAFSRPDMMEMCRRVGDEVGRGRIVNRNGCTDRHEMRRIDVRDTSPKFGGEIL